MEHRLIISLVTWNSAQYLDVLFASLKEQTDQSLELLVSDNASTDDTVTRLSEFLPALPFPATLFREKENTGFARAHNHHIREAIRRKARFVLVVNPDCVLEPHACAILRAAITRDDRAGSVGGKILRAHFAHHSDGLTTLEKTSTIDSTGLIASGAGQWHERGAGDRDHGQYAEGAVFGVTGAFALYRVRALVDVSWKEAGKREFFDEDFFAYKEDVDLAWRLQLYGWSAWYAPQAVLWHHRMFGRERGRSVPVVLRSLSWRNHLLLLWKNFDVRFDLATFLTIARECAKFFWILVWEPRTLQLSPSLFRLWNIMRHKRQWMQTHRRQSPNAMQELFRSFRSLS